MLSRNRLYVLLGTLSAAGIVFIASLAIFAFEDRSLVLCPLNRLTGIPCPSCGTTRALLLLFQGHATEALLMNPLVVPATILAIVVPGWIVADLLRGSDSLHQAWISVESVLKKGHPVAWLLVVLIIANWIWNMFKGL